MTRYPKVAAWCALCLLGCGDPSRTTELIVSIDSNLSIPTEIDGVVLTVEFPSGEKRQASGRLADPDKLQLPLTFDLAWLGGRLGDVHVRVDGTLSTEDVVTMRVLTAFVHLEVRRLDIFLAQECIGVPCSFGETCRAEGCGSSFIPSAELPAWTASP